MEESSGTCPSGEYISTKTGHGCQISRGTDGKHTFCISMFILILSWHKENEMTHH